MVISPVDMRKTCCIAVVASVLGMCKKSVKHANRYAQQSTCFTRRFFGRHSCHNLSIAANKKLHTFSVCRWGIVRSFSTVNTQ